MLSLSVFFHVFVPFFFRVFEVSFSPKEFQWLLKGYLKFKRSFKDDTRKFYGCFQEVWRVFQGSFKNVSRTFLRNVKGVSRKF